MKIAGVAFVKIRGGNKMSYYTTIKKIKEDDVKLKELVLSTMPVQYHCYLYFGNRNMKIGNAKEISQEEKSLGAYYDKDKEAIYYPSVSPYMTIAGRIRWFVDDHIKAGKKYKIREDIDTEHSIYKVVIESEIYGEAPGSAEIIKGAKSGVDSKNPLENAGTSAIGRALILFGYGLLPVGVTSSEEYMDYMKSHEIHTEGIVETEKIEDISQKTESIEIKKEEVPKSVVQSVSTVVDSTSKKEDTLKPVTNPTTNITMDITKADPPKATPESTTNQTTVASTMTSPRLTQNIHQTEADASRRKTLISDIKGCIQVLGWTREVAGNFIKDQLRLVEYKDCNSLTNAQVETLYGIFKDKMTAEVHNLALALNLSEEQLYEFEKDCLQVEDFDYLIMIQIISVYNSLKEEVKKIPHTEETGQEEFKVVEESNTVEDSFSVVSEEGSVSSSVPPTIVNTITAPPLKTTPTDSGANSKPNEIGTLSKLSKDDLLNKVKNVAEDRERAKMDIKQLLDFKNKKQVE